MKEIISIILFLSFVFNIQAQERIRIHKSHFNLSANVKSFTLKTKNYQQPNKLYENSDVYFISNDPNYTSEFYFNQLGFLVESKSLQEGGYEWRKYEFSNSPINPVVTKITVSSKKNVKDEYEPDRIMDIKYKNKSALITTVNNDGTKQKHRMYIENGNVVREHLIPDNGKVFVIFSKNRMI